MVVLEELQGSRAQVGEGDERTTTTKASWKSYCIHVLHMHSPPFTIKHYYFCWSKTPIKCIHVHGSTLKSTVVAVQLLSTSSVPSFFLFLLLLPVHQPSRLDCRQSSETGRFLHRHTFRHPVSSDYVRREDQKKNIPSLLSTNSLHSSFNSDVFWLTSGSSTRSLLSSSK